MTALTTVLALTILNIFPTSVGEEESVAADIRRYVKATGQHKVLYSLSFHPQGTPARKKADCLVASYARLAKLLERDDVELGVLVQSVLGHGWSWCDGCREDWTRSVRIDGSEARYCVLDSGFRGYVHDFVSGLARAKPAFVLADDDIHQRTECFCDLHRREFNRRAGTDYTADAYRRAVAASKPGERNHDVFYGLQRESLVGFCSLIREAIDEVDPAIPAGICMSGAEYPTVGPLAKALAAKGQRPFIRIANDGSYAEFSSGEFAETVVGTAVHAALYARDFDTVEESDTFPHSHWARSGATVMAKMAMSLMCGIGGGLHWYAGAHSGGHPVPSEFLSAIAYPMGLYRGIRAFARDSVPVGLVIPAMTHFPENRMTGDDGTLVPRNWGGSMAVQFGIPIRSAAELGEEGVYAISGGSMVGRFSDGELRRILSGRVLLDGDAVRAIAHRGFTNVLGVVVSDVAPSFTGEVSADGRRCYPFVHNASHPPPGLAAAPGAEVLTWLEWTPYNGAAERTRVVPGAVYFRNALGGEVVSAAWTTETGGTWSSNRFHTLSDARKEWLVELLGRLGGADLYVENRQDVVALARRKPDGTRLLFALNLNRDPMKTVTIRVRGGFAALDELGMDGIYRPVAFTRNGDAVTIAKPLTSYGFAVWRIAPPAHGTGEVP